MYDMYIYDSYMILYDSYMISIILQSFAKVSNHLQFIRKHQFVNTLKPFNDTKLF